MEYNGMSSVWDKETQTVIGMTPVHESEQQIWSRPETQPYIATDKGPSGR